MPKLTPTRREKRVVQERIALNKERMLKCLRAGTSVADACDTIGVTLRQHYGWRDVDEEYRRACSDVMEVGTQRLESEAYRRATEGKSDTMLIFLLKARRPDVYRDRYQQVDINHKMVDLTKRLGELRHMSTEELEAAESALMKVFGEVGGEVNGSEE